MAKQSVRDNRKQQLGEDELAILCEQIALIVRSGLPLHDGVEALSENYRDSRLAAAFQALNQTVLESGSLYLGLQASGVFPTYMVEMANIGERTGELDTVMNGLSLYYQREAKVHRAIVNALTYPLILIAIMATLIIVLITGVLPVFDGVFRNMGLDAASSPWLAAGVNVGKTVLVLAAVAIALLLLMVVLTRTDKSGRFRRSIVQWIAPLRRISRKMAASRFAAVMGMMLRSGYPLQDSLKLVGNVITDAAVVHALQTCREQLEQGLSFPDAVAALDVFEPLHMRMIRVGFQTGQIDGVMQRLSALYDDEVDDAITHAVSVVEPSLAALMSVIIGAILLAVMLPLLSLMGGMA